MNKDQVAIYLNEHLEFFNEYPELLRKIKEIEEEDLPIEPMGTLSLADRIIKRVHDDKEHLKTKLEWLFEISRANEKIQTKMIHRIFFALLIIFSLAVGLLGCGHKAPPKPPAKEVKV